MIRIEIISVTDLCLKRGAIMFKWLLLLIFPILITAYPTPNFDNCRVKHDLRFELWSGSSIRFMSFISQIEELSLDFTFHGNDDYYDRLYLSSSGNTMLTSRGGIPEEKTLSSNLNATGWTDFQIKMSEEQLEIYTWSVLAFRFIPDYQIHTLRVFASNVTMCPEQTPSWTIENNEEILPLTTKYIATNPLLEKRYDASIGIIQPKEERYCQVSFYSTVPFSPKISIAGKSIFFSLIEDDTIVFSNKDFPDHLKPGIYNVLLQFNDRKAILSHMHEGISKLSKEIQLKNTPEYMTIQAVNSRFAVSLTLFDTAIGDNGGGHIQGISTLTMVMSLLIVIAIAIAVAVAVALFFIKKSKRKAEKSSDEPGLLQSSEKSNINKEDGGNKSARYRRVHSHDTADEELQNSKAREQSLRRDLMQKSLIEKLKDKTTYDTV